MIHPYHCATQVEEAISSFFPDCAVALLTDLHFTGQPTSFLGSVSVQNVWMSDCSDLCSSLLPFLLFGFLFHMESEFKVSIIC